MPKLSPTRIRELVRTLNYVVSIHAAEELEDDHLTIVDLESVLLSGRIVQRQKDPQTREVKSVVRGHTIEGIEVETVVKLGPTGTLFVITVYRA